VSLHNVYFGVPLVSGIGAVVLMLRSYISSSSRMLVPETVPTYCQDPGPKDDRPLGNGD
jgi:hypothetical protein